MISQMTLAFLVVYLYGVTDGVPSLVSNVICIDNKNAERRDVSWDYHKWGTGVEQWQNNGPRDVKICDQFIELAKTAGRCLYDDGLMCELNTTDIDIGAAWIDTAGRFKGKVSVLIKDKNHFRWVTTSETQCHGHKFRVQFYGSQPNKQVKGSAVLACGVAKAHDSNNNVDNYHDACRFKSYATSA